MTVVEKDPIRIGIDLGGTKIAAASLLPDGRAGEEIRIDTPREYDGTLEAIRQLVLQVEADAGGRGTVGVGMPGSISPATGLVQNANSVWLNGRPFDRDLARLLDRQVRVANDANCFALSEAADGAAAGAHCVFGIILGTGCGGGIVIDGKLHDGPRGIAGEWGHNPLPWPGPDEYPEPRCWCGRPSCIETWVSGPAMEADHTRATGQNQRATDIAEHAAAGDTAAQETLRRHASRLARGLSAVVNLLDPDVIVIGGGLSKLQHLYSMVPDLMLPYVLLEKVPVKIRPPKWGDASGLRGAAWLWGHAG